MKARVWMLLLVLLQLKGLNAQILQPVTWSFGQQQTGEDTYELIFTADIDAGWHLYSQHIDEGGPVPTGFYFDESEDFTLEGPTTESGKSEEKYDHLFEMDLKWFSDQAVFRQKVRVEGEARVTGYLEFMVCDDEKCLPPETYDFSFVLKPKAAETEKEKAADPPDRSEAPSKSEQEAEEKAETRGEEPPVDIITLNPGGAGGILQPVSWTFETRVEEGKGEVLLTAEIDAGWHLYAMDLPENGPIPTTFYLENEGADVAWTGPWEELGEKVTKFDEIFEMELSWFGEKVTFRRTFDPSGSPDRLTGEVEFMVCDDEKCLPPELVGFDLDLQASSVVAVSTDGQAGTDTSEADFRFDWTRGETNCHGHDGGRDKRGNWMILLLGFGGGLIALLTPCVFPMIPLTVTFFTKGGKDRSKGIANALIYGISIVVIYVALGLIITGTLGSDALNAMSTSAFFNLLFFFVFVIFAISFFGFFEITLPSSWANRSDQAADRGGLVGIFFMAFTLSLVSFSCTGPIIGTLLVEAATGGGATLFNHIPVKPLLGMLGFSLALSIPFTMFAAFPSWLSSLPKSGSWLDTVKKVLGFLELALALKFLSVADMAYGWGILKFELFLALWILIFFGLGLYSLGIWRFPGEGNQGRPGIGRIALGLFSFFFVAYLANGLFRYEPLKAMSGLAPPVHYNYFKPAAEPSGDPALSKEGCPADLYCFKDYEEGMAYARRVNMPVLVDFTGYGCVNCRKMEENVWTEEDVNELMREFVLISLYVDDKKSLPEEEMYVSSTSGREKKIRTVGNKWSDFQARYFKTNSQPYYVILSPEEELLNMPVGYTPDKRSFKEFLTCGLVNFEIVCPDCVASAH